jgi:aspartyl-tRNA(Asn)/glutamyl-tRNA(Gln) amidotransferase subunit B
MEKGEFRVDTNVSVNIKEREEEGRAEIKNLNSFNAIKSAIEYEVRRQTELLKGGKHVERETRLWDEEKKETRVMRTKEFVEDYRYFPEPDIPSFEIDNRWLKEELPFLPCYYYKKFSETGASYKEMDILSSSPFFSRFCLEVFEKVPYSKAKGWIFTEILQYVEDIESLNSLPFTVSDFVDFINRVIKGEIPRHIGQEIIRRSMEENKSLREFFKDKVEIKKGEEIEDVVKEVIDENVEVVNKIKSGKVSAVSFLVGQVMRKLKGKANPKEVKEKIEEILGLN